VKERFGAVQLRRALERQGPAEDLFAQLARYETEMRTFLGCVFPDATK
jgi:hypothetical protein